jgi:hypothetical protein
VNGLGADHIPILITIDLEPPDIKRGPTRWSYKKAKWDKFKELLEGTKLLKRP